MNLRERSTVAGRASPSHSTGVHAAEWCPNLLQVVISHLRAAWIGHAPGWLRHVLREAVTGVAAGIEPGRARNSFFRAGSFVPMAAVGTGSIGDARKNIGGAK